MTKFKYTKGSERDFEGAPDWVTLLTVSSIGKYYIEKLGAGFSRALNINTGNEFTIPADLQFGDTIIAQREPIADDGWIEWNGGDCPVQKGTLVDVKYRDGEEVLNLKALEIDNGYVSDASWAFWRHSMSLSDIIAYRLSQPEVAESPAWDGKSIPPVGVECEYKWQNDRWRIGTVLFKSQQTLLMREQFDGVDSESAYGIDDVSFRRIRSAEEIEREKAFCELYRLEKSMPDGYQPHELIEAIISAGYRKVN